MMKNYSKEEKQTSDLFDEAAPKRREKTLREFKEVLQHLIYLLRSAVKADTAYLYWVNRSRRQFVKEAHSTDVKDARFQDRVAFEDHFLNQYKNIEKPLNLNGEGSTKSVRSGSKTVKQMLLIPFVNQAETVALTVLEWKKENQPEQVQVIENYTATLGKLLNTYLEMTDLYESQQEWVEYEKKLEFLTHSGPTAALLEEMIQTLQSFMTNGSVSLIAKGQGSWCSVLNARMSARPLPVGMSLEKRTLTADTLKSGSDEFTIHFNKNPKRISPREELTDGASYAVPLTVNKKTSAVVLINDENPLTFKESAKHKLKNIVRLTGYKIESCLNETEEGGLFLNGCGAFIPDIWERVIETELHRLKEDRQVYHTWTGFATLSNLSKLRTRLRMEEMKCLQKDLVAAFNPGRFGITGIVGSHSDYRYLILLQSRDEKALSHWQQEINEKFDKPFILSNGLEIQVSVQTGFVKLDKNFEDSYEVVQLCKPRT